MESVLSSQRGTSAFRMHDISIWQHRGHVSQEEGDIRSGGFKLRFAEQHVGCIILDPPMEFELADLLQCLVNLTTEFPPPFTIVLYSQWSFKSVENGIKNEEKLRSSKLTLTEFLMLKVRGCNLLAR